MKLEGTVKELRGHLATLSRASVEDGHRRNWARLGSLACLAAAYLWGAWSLPNLIAARSILAALLLLCTAVLIRLDKPDPDPDRMGDILKLLNLLRAPAEGRGPLTLEADLTPDGSLPSTDPWLVLTTPLRQGRLTVKAGRGGGLEVDLNGRSATAEGMREAILHSSERQATVELMETEILRTVFAARPEAGGDADPARWLSWYLETLDGIAEPF